MDGFPSFTPQPAVTMGNFVSTLLQLKSQVELMDQFLSIYVPGKFALNKEEFQ